METYELLAIIKPTMDSEELDAEVGKIESTIKGLKGNISSVNKIGRKRIAYDIADFKEGYWITVLLELPQDKVVDLKRALKLNENVLRIMFVKSSKVKVN